MAFNHRKLFLPSNSTTCSDILCVYEAKDLGYCHQYCALACPSVCPPPPPPPPRTHHISPLVYILVAVLGSAFLLVSYYVVLVKYCSNRNRSRGSPPQSEETHEEFLDENHGPVIDHPIWFINTVGLRESIINSITVCKYNRGDGLVEGTECSVCLNEFKEDETLRLLPKCSHAFHVPCIDTWLASHTNCPLCRAPIVSNAAGPPLALTQPNSNNFGAEDEIQAENSVGDGGLGNNQSREGGVCELRVGTEDEVESRLEDGKFEKEGVPSSHSNCGFRVPSDLGDYRVEGENEMQPVRRSVSMDSVSASMICFSMTNILPSEPEGSSSTQLVQGRKSNSGIVPKRAGGNPSIFKLMGNSFTGRSLQRGPISMKRSSSCGGKLLFSTNGTTQNPILPL